MIAIVEVVCERCGSTATQEASELFVQIDAEVDPSGRLMFECATCADLSTVEVDLRTVATLLLAGARHLCRPLTQAGIRAAEDGERSFTPEDVLTWHQALRGVDSVGPWE